MDEVQPAVLLLGDVESPRTRALVQTVRETVPAASLREAVGLAAVRQVIGAGEWFPDLIVVLQSWSDEFSAADVLELIALAPLARLVCACGPWCDSDGRNRAIWPHAVRVPFAEAPARIAAELASLQRSTSVHAPARERTPSPAITRLPRTASRAEVFAALSDQGFPPGCNPGPVAIVSPDRPLRQMLAQALRQQGGQVVDADGATGPAAIVWDADPWNGDRAAELAATRRQRPNATIIAAVALPHPALEEELRDSGADGIWFKLAPTARLLALLATGRQTVSHSV
jgi:hypothetical protein